MTRSGLRRYPSHLLDSLASQGERAPRGPDHDTPPDFESPPTFAAWWLGHATVLLRMGARWILTDPVFSDRIGPRIGGRTIGLARHTPTPVHPTQLPPIDLILISHAHFDHLDRPSLRRLASPHCRVVTAPGTADLIPPGFGPITELRPGHSWHAGSLSIKAVEPAHWGSRFALDRWRGCNAYVIEAAGRRVVFAGDTADTDAFDAIDGADLGVFGIGAYEPWEHMHATPEQAWHMAARLGADRLLPVHHSTFELSDEPPGEPMDRLLAAAGDSCERIIDRPQGVLWTPGD